MITITQNDPVRAAIANFPVHYDTSGCAYTALCETLAECGYYLYCDYYGHWVDITGSMGHTSFELVDSDGRDCKASIEFDWHTMCTLRVELVVSITEKIEKIV